MLNDMLAALERASSVGRVAVVSADEALLRHASLLGAEVIEEGRPRGLNAAVALAAAVLEENGVDRLLTIPGDVPLIGGAEVDRLFATDPAAHPVVLVPSASGSGTNGLLTSPPTVILSRFEGNSLKAHQQACREAGIEPLVLPLQGFMLDVDTPDDLTAMRAATAAGRSVVRAAG
jgi:2-phospho-L-lactate guanylyltransferase